MERTEMRGIGIDRDMARGIAKLVILSQIKKNKTYPYALLRCIKGHPFLGRFVSKSDVYNITTALEKDGYIKGNARVSGGKLQKIYTITPDGAEVVKNKDRIIRRTISDFKKLIKEEFDE